MLRYLNYAYLQYMLMSYKHEISFLSVFITSVFIMIVEKLM